MRWLDAVSELRSLLGVGQLLVRAEWGSSAYGFRERPGLLSSGVCIWWFADISADLSCLVFGTVLLTRPVLEGRQGRGPGLF